MVWEDFYEVSSSGIITTKAKYWRRFILSGGCQVFFELLPKILEARLQFCCAGIPFGSLLKDSIQNVVWYNHCVIENSHPHRFVGLGKISVYSLWIINHFSSSCNLFRIDTINIIPVKKKNTLSYLCRKDNFVQHTQIASHILAIPFLLPSTYL